jgi:hypothetical protein
MTKIRRRGRVRTTMTMVVVVNDFLGLYYQNHNIHKKCVTIRLNSKAKCVLTWPYEILKKQIFMALQYTAKIIYHRHFVLCLWEYSAPL